MGQDANQNPAESPRKDELAGLSTSRADFATSLGRRVESLGTAILALEQEPASSPRRDYLLQRLHALQASAKVLGFAAAADVLSRTEQRLRTAQVDTLLDDLTLARKHLSDLPALVQRGTYSIAPPSIAEQTSGSLGPPSAKSTLEPFCILLFGKEDLCRTLLSAQPEFAGLEVSSTTEASELRQLAAAIGPDAIVLDVAQGSVALLVDELTQSPETSHAPIVALNVPDEIARSLEELGVRSSLSSRATDQQILRTIYAVRKPKEQKPRSFPPFGEVSLPELASRIAQEITLGLVETVPQAAQSERVALGDGTEVRAAIWSAIAQIREQVVEQSNGRIQFDRGPDGSVPLAPGPRPFARGGGQLPEPVDLSGRRILVADDDPAVAWLVGGTLRAAGAVVTEAHDGARALELAYRIWPELIVSDILMPGLDGFALCHSIKRDVLLRDVPIVLLSWKEDLLFRLRDLGSDADGYLRKEATASTIVKRVQELLGPRRALELRIARSLTAKGTPLGEARGRLDATTVRQLLEIACSLARPVRIALRDATALYDLRVREGALKAATRTRHDGTIERGESVLMELIGVTAGRFSVTSDDDPLESQFDAPLPELLRPYALRARAAQRVLSGLTLGLVDKLVLDADAFTDEPSSLPLSLRPVADELRRGTAPRSLLASGVASVHLLESLLADVARRGKVRAITGAEGEDLLEQELLALTSAPAAVPPRPAPAPTPLFTFQLSPSPPDTHERTAPTPSILPGATASSAGTSIDFAKSTDSPQPNPDTWGKPSGTLAGVGKGGSSTLSPTGIPVSKAPPSEDVDWALELNWDSTPPPASPATAPVSEPPVSRPATSGGFMRPTLATLERRSHNETPDLANAVAKAVSAAAPVEFDALAPKLERNDNRMAPSEATASASSPRNMEVGPNANAVEAPLEPPEEQMQPGPSLPRAAEEPRNPDEAAPTVAGTDIAKPTATTPSTSDSAAETTDSALLALAPTPAPVTEAQSTNVPTVARLQIDLAVAPPLVNPPPLTPVDSVRISATSAIPTTTEVPRVAVSIPGVIATNATVSETTVPIGKSLTVSTTTVALEDGTAPILPVVQKPPRPSVPDRGPTVHREFDSDPVFPLVSAAPPAVEIQPAIELGGTTSEPAPGQTIAKDASSAPPMRDTLRSPGDSVPGGPAIVATEPSTDKPAESVAGRAPTAQVASLHAEMANDNPSYATSEKHQQGDDQGVSRRGAQASNGDGAPKSAPTSIDSDLPKSSPQALSGIETRRHVSWVQAVGLSFLAGVVTFAITVQLARWWRDRAHAPDVQTEATASPIGTNSAPGPVVSAESLPLPTASASASAAAAQPSATIDEIQVPSDVTLAAGQALIEITTAGGHAIFLDDSFVGRGPLRVVTVAPGRHVVRTRLNGVERTDHLEVGAGHAMRLSLEKAWK